MTIPKVIHYCWFGGKPLPKSALECLESWHRLLPDYEIKRWDETNFNIDSNSYTRDAYTAGKYAFVSDYARFYILYHEGGVYFDTDVEVIKDMSPLIAHGPFMGCETTTPGNPAIVNPGLGLGAVAGMSLLKEILDYYDKLAFTNSEGQQAYDTVVTHTTKILRNHFLPERIEKPVETEGFTIYPVDYFCPISTIDAKLRITPNTQSIHHFSQSWQSPARRIGRKLLLRIGGMRLKELVKSIIYRKPSRP